jgi:uncharacterized OB-fold protein
MSVSPETQYRDALADGRFQIQHCRDCAKAVFPPSVICDRCGSLDLDWKLSSGHGVVHACTVVSRHPDKGGPYNVVLVDMSDGIRLMSHVPDQGDRDVPIGTNVTAKIEADTHRLVFTTNAESGHE